MKTIKSLSLVIFLLLIGLFLYACTQSKELVLQFNSNGGTEVSSILTDTKSVDFPTDPTKEGYTFEGWFWDNETFLVPLSVDAIPETLTAPTMTVYAKWVLIPGVIEYTITFDSMGGSLVNPISSPYQASIQQPSDPTNDSFLDFGGWYLDIEYTQPYTFTTMPENNFTLYAKWINTLELTTDPISITLWHAEKTTNQALLQSYANSFMALYPNITVNIPLGFSSYDRVQTEVNGAVFGGEELPNIVQATSNHVAEYIHNDFLLQLNPYIYNPLYGFSNLESLDDILLSFREESSQYDLDGTYYALPFSKSTEVMIYNKTAFDALDLDVPETWQDIIATTTILKNYGAQFNNIDHVIPAVYDSPNNAFITLIKQFQGAYTSLNYDDMTGECLWVDDANTLSAMNFLKTNKNAFTIPLFWDQSYGTVPFMEQKTFMMISSMSDIRYNIPPIDQITGLPIFEIGVAPIPQNSELPNSRAVLQKGTDLALMDTGTDQEQLASWLFIKYLTSIEITADWAVNTGNLPVRTSAYQTATYQEFLHNPTEVQKNNSLVANAAILQLDDLFFAPAFIRSNDAWIFVGEALERILQGDGKIEEALEDAVLK